MGGKPPQYSWEFGRDGSRSATPCLVVFNTLSGAKTHPARLSPAETEAQFGPQWEAGLPVPAGFLQDGRGHGFERSCVPYAFERESCNSMLPEATFCT